MISEEIKNNYPLLNERISELENYALEYDKRFYKRIVYQSLDKSASPLGYRGITYLLRITQKSRYAYYGCLDCINKQNLAIAFLASRAHFEVTAALGYFLYYLYKFYDREISDAEINDILLKLSLGYKKDIAKSESFQPPQAINVITMIDKTDKLFLLIAPNKEDYKEKIFSSVYEDLSEKCHPNFEGISFGGVCIDRIVYFSDSPKLREDDFEDLLRYTSVPSRKYATIIL